MLVGFLFGNLFVNVKSVYGCVLGCLELGFGFGIVIEFDGALQVTWKS